MKEKTNYKEIIFDFKRIYGLNIKEDEKNYLYAKVHRVLGVPFISISLLLRLRPNFVTLISFLSSLLSGILFLQFNVIPAILLYEFSRILDYVDGCVGRIQNIQSKFGAVLDSLVDKFNIIFSAVTISFGAYLKYNNTNILFLGIFLLCIWTYREWTHSIIDKIIGYNQAVQNLKNSIKSKSAILSKATAIFLDLMLFLLPFSVLFGIELMVKFFIAYVCIESFRLIIDFLIFFINMYKKG